ncbi:hypothetical protein ACFWBI_09000 [Streptomyces sp. NPDC059982]|uniref:zinc finger domain-containing protein n=1 Tax=unclassified Streptomyces TaxID=2593676 RepID=UPI0036CFDBD6
MTHRTQLNQPAEAPNQVTLDDLELTVACPTCPATAGNRCITRAGKPARESHGRRDDALRDAAGITGFRYKHEQELKARGYTVTWDDPKGERALMEAYAARVRPAPQPAPEPDAPTETAIEPKQITTPARRQLDHALTALARTTPGRRRYIRAAAANYLAQVDHRILPVGYDRPIYGDWANRADAYEMRGGRTVAAMLGLAVRPTDADFPTIARAIVTAVDAPVDHLVQAARTSGAPAAIALLHLVGGAR